MLDDLHRWTGEASNLKGIGPKGYAGADDGSRGEDGIVPAEAHVHVGSASYGWGEGNDDMRRPGERLSVFQCQADFTRRDGKRRTMVHGFRSEAALWLGEVVVRSKPLASAAGALSFMSRGLYDIRPSLLLVMYAEDASHIEACLRHGRLYLSAWCNARGVTRGEAAIRAAAADALQHVFDRRERKNKRWPLRERAKAVRLNPAAFSELRRVAIGMYRRRLAEAVVAYRESRRKIDSTRESLHSNTGKHDRPPGACSSRASPRNGWIELQLAC